MACNHCIDPDGDNCYPYYGLKPHTHDLSKTGSLIGSTIFDKEEKLPDNFQPDSECPGMGTYLYCPYCGGSSDWLEEIIETH